MNVALMGGVSSTHACLDALVRAGVDVIAVLGLDESLATQVSDYASLRPLAATAGVPFKSFFRVADPEVESFMRKHDPDLIWVIGLSQIVPPNLIRIARHGAVGFHPTMLPRGRGRAPVAWTILLGEPAAVNLFYLTDEPDAGDIIVQREVPVLPDDYSEDLIVRTNSALAEAILDLAPLIKAGTLPRTPQDHSRASYYPKRTAADGLIDWSKTSADVYRLIRAAGRPYPGAFSYLGAHKVTVWRARPTAKSDLAPNLPVTEPGMIIRVGQPGAPVAVRCGDGALWLDEVEIDSETTTVEAQLAVREHFSDPPKETEDLS